MSNEQYEKTFSMPRESFDKWLTALRSGNYEQGRGQLQNSTTCGYCCLGVLQKVLDGDVERASTGLSHALPTQEWALEHDCHFINPPNFKELGFNPCLPSIGKSTQCSSANDAWGLSFIEIADALERHYKEPEHV